MAADPEENKTKLADLTKQLKDLKTTIGEKRLPCREPSSFDESCRDFKAWAASVENFLATKGVKQGNRVRCLLTYLESEVYNHIMRVTTTADLEPLDYNEAVDRIARIVDQELSDVEACIKLSSKKQGGLSLKKYLIDIECLASLAWPSQSDRKAREKNLIATLLNGVGSKSITFELYKYRTNDQGQPRSFADICAKALDLDMLIKSRSDDDSSDLVVLNVEKEVKKCHICASPQHLRSQCTMRKPQERTQFQQAQSRPQNFGQRPQFSRPPFRPQFSRPPFRPQFNRQINGRNMSFNRPQMEFRPQNDNYRQNFRPNNAYAQNN